MIEYLSNPQTWSALLTIIGINIVLSGDNAVVIALACRSLPPKQQKLGIAWGSGIAVVLRIIFTIFIAYLLTVPYLKFFGGLLLFWVGYKLVVGDDGGDEVDAASNIWHAARIVVVADAVMSLDNVIAVAAAAKGDFALLVLGLLISIPMVVYGATMLIKLIERYPVIVPGGAALIGFIGGEVIVSDHALEPWIEQNAAWVHQLGPLLGAIGVIVGSRIVAPLPKISAEVIAEEAAVGAALLLGRTVLMRLAAFVVGAVAYSVGDAAPANGGSPLMQVMHGLRPIFAAAIAIVLGEVAAWVVRRVRAGTPAT